MPRSAVQAAYKIAHGELGDSVEADGRLVEKKHFRAVQQRSGNFAPHPLAEAELARRRSDKLGKAEQVGQLRKAAAVVGLRHAVDVPDQGKRIDHGHVPPKLGALAEHDPDFPHMLPARLPGDKAVDPALAAVRR